MKKTIKFLLALVAGLTALASCREEFAGGIFHEDSGEIRFGSNGVRVETKSFVETDNATLQSDGFNVAAVIDADGSVMFNTTVTYESGDGVYRVPDAHYYYPNEGTMSFYGVYPTSEEISIGADGKATVTYSQNPEEDLVAAKATVVAKQTAPVMMTFDHLLSQVSMTARSDNDNVDCKLCCITISDSDGGIYSLTDGVWTPGDGVTDYDFFTNADGESLTTSATPVGEAMSFIPGEVLINIKWKCFNKTGGQLINDNDQTVEVSLLQGKHSTLNLTLPSNPDEISFVTSVGAWADEEIAVAMPLAAEHTVSATAGESVVLPTLKLEDDTKGYIVWGDGSMEKFSSTATRAGSDDSFLIPEHTYSAAFSGKAQIYVTSGKIGAGQFMSERSYSIVNSSLAELIPIKAIRFGNADQPSFVCFLSATGNQNLEYSYNGLEWKTFNHTQILGLAPAVLGGGTPDAGYMAMLMSSPEEAGVLPIGPGLSSAGFAEHGYVYLRGNNPTGFNHANPDRTGATGRDRGIYDVMGMGLSEGMFCSIPIAFLSGEPAFTHLACDGNIMHLINYEEDITEIPCDFCFSSLFACWDDYSFYTLTSAPELPAGNLKPYCYDYMFHKNISLEKAPELPAAILAEGCYYNIFNGCASLNYVKCLATDVTAENCIYGWLDHTAGTGTFVRSKRNDVLTNLNAAMIPRGWTVKDTDGATIDTRTPGLYTVNMAGKKVRFAPGLLYWNGSEFKLEEHQYDYYFEEMPGREGDGVGEWNPEHLNYFFWSKDARVACAEKYEAANAKLGITPSAEDTFFAIDGGAIPGWTVLSKDEWNFVAINARQHKDSGNDPYMYVIDGISCHILIPDGYTSDILQDTYTAEEWAAAESEYGLVALPLGGSRNEYYISNHGDAGYFWSCTSHSKYEASDILFHKFDNLSGGVWREYGKMIRLVQFQ